MSFSKFLPFSLPELGQQEIDEVVDSLLSGWITTGPKAKQFETEFGDFLGGGLECISVNSATSGLHLALEALGIGPGDEVIIPSYTFTATAEVIRYLSATPVFVDVNAHDFNISVEKIKAEITPKTKAIIPVHFGGQACEMDDIIELAKQFDIKIVEDAAHALPTKYKGSFIGQLESDVTVFSFYANKTMTTAEGGMVVTKNQEIANRCRIMRLHGISRDAFDRYTSKTPSWYYEIVAPGYKYNMPDICAAIGIHQLRRLSGFQIKRAKMADFYTEKLEQLPLKLPTVNRTYDQHAWHLYPVQLLPEVGMSRDNFIEAMAERGVGCAVHFIPLHLQPYWRDTYRLKASDYPISQELFEREVSLPLYTRMSEEDMLHVITAIKRVLGDYETM